MRFGLILTTLVIAITIAGMLIVNAQQVSAPRDCGSCVQFKKLTHEFEKAVIEAATNGDPNTIPSLLEQYASDVRALDLASR